MKKKVLFIINPRAGRQKGTNILEKIQVKLDLTRFDWDSYITKKAGEAAIVSQREAQNNDILVAVGGDGSVNQVAAGVVGSDTALGIIPAGSGNGLARGLHIPLHVNGAIEVLNRMNIRTIDTAKVNDHFFVNLAGMGFDAHLAHRCSGNGHRGLIAHFKSAANSIHNYSAKKCRFIFNGQEASRETFLVTISNSGQYGNNAHISPQARVDDGLLEVCILSKFPIRAAPGLVLRLFNKTIHHSPYYSYFQCKEVKVQAEEKLEAHVDGEPMEPVYQLDVRINPHSLRVITGNKS